MENVNIESVPLCLDENNYTLTRTCELINWIPALSPVCSHTQKSYEILNKCPPSFDSIYYAKNEPLICVKLTDPQPWTATECALAGSGQTIFDLQTHFVDKIVEYIEQKSATGQVWIPAKWNSNSIRWILPPRLGEQIPEDEILIYGNTFRENGCVLLHLNQLTIMKTECKEHYPILCVYNEKQSLKKLACPENTFTTRYKFTNETLCYSITDTHEYFEDNQLFIMNSAERTYQYEHLFELSNRHLSEKCIFNPFSMKSVEATNKIQWEEQTNIVEYVNWNRYAMPYKSSDHEFLVADSEGKWSFDVEFQCIARQMNITLIEPELIIELILMPTSKQLQIHAYNTRSLWNYENGTVGIHCFYANEDELNETVLQLESKQNQLGPKRSYVILTELKPGYYWCEGFSILNYTFISTEKIYIDRPDHFAGTVFICANCFEGQIEKEFDKLLRIALSGTEHFAHVLIENATIRRSEIIWENFVRIWFHVTILFNGEYENPEPNNLNMTDRHMLRVYYKRKIFMQMLQIYPFFIGSINSTEYCLPNSISILNTQNWLGSRIGQITTSLEMCLQISGIPILRICRGNAIDGGEWHYINESQCHFSSAETPMITTQLFDLSHSFVRANQTEKVLESVSNLMVQATNLLSADVVYVSQIMESVATFNNRLPLDDIQTENIYSIYNRLMDLDVKITANSSILNSTNVLLISFDQLINNLRINDLNTVNEFSTFQVDKGVRSIITPNLMTHIIDSGIQNITGIGLFLDAKQEETDDLLRYSIRFLYKNQSCSDLQHEPGLQLATFIPEDLIEFFGNDSVKIIISVFINDILFQVPFNENEIKANSMIISISVPDYDTSHLPIPLPIFMKLQSFLQTEWDMGGYWNYSLMTTAWCDAGTISEFIDDNTVWINATHLTHFAYLLHGKLDLTKNHIDTLNVITVFGCTLSLLGIVGICVTAVIFRSWRTKLSAKLLLQLCTAISLQMIILCFINTESNTKSLLHHHNFMACIILGAIHHYLILVIFVWMLIIAYLQFMRYVIVFKQLESNWFILKSSCLSWGISLVPVCIVLAVDPNLYIPPDTNDSICYPTGYALYFAVMFPIAIVILANLIVYIIVIYNLIWKPKTVVRAVDRSEIIAQLRLSIFLFFLLGLTWIFGFLGSAAGIGIVFSYMFCVTATIQGFVLFLYFIVLDPIARNLWICWVKRLLRLQETGSITFTDSQKSNK